MSASAAERVESAQPVYLTPGQVAELLQVNQRAVLRWVAEDASLPATRIGRVIRFERASLLRWLARKRPRSAQSPAQAASSAA
jgi:excisionase family DNA binding protein